MNLSEYINVRKYFHQFNSKSFNHENFCSDFSKLSMTKIIDSVLLLMYSLKNTISIEF